MFSSLGLVALTLASAVLADDLAFSVSTADFKARFVQSGIVPEVIAALDPSVSFYASYRAADGHSELLVPGSSLTVAEAGGAPLEFSVENLSNATSVNSQTRFLIYLLDADAPDRSAPNARNLRHFLAGNYTLSSAMSAVLPTAQRLTVTQQTFFPFTPFTAPNPAPNTGVHRFIYALYTQPPNFNTVGFQSVGMELQTANWNLSRWRTQLGLGPAIGATFFSIDTGANGGQGVSANGSTFVGGGAGAGAGTGVPAAPGAAAPGVAASLSMAGLAGLAATLGVMAMF
ncbi:phosphatidylethanolamine-binding protein [Schizothecium vesticola]|uniref:Phosphatidylethanolamine-binding protein n=1 Tax=Schizothecium vesticola TaxID=314040 RepID=A0AA40ELJ6_9PEZI|nr:phosphatidylethanolamine-binding protein [Schizothecium vesticola]